MNTYKVTFDTGIEATHTASDMRALLTVVDCVWHLAEPVKVERIAK